MHTSHAAVSTDRHPQFPGNGGWRSVGDDRRPASTERGGGLGEENRPERAVAQDVAALMHEIDGLRRRLGTQPTIEQAKGVLVATYGIDADTAFDVLVRWSQHTNTKLRLLAAGLVAAASDPSAEPGAGLHRFIGQLPGSGLTPPPPGRSA